MRLPNRVPFNCRLSTSGVRTSGTFSRKYPVAAWPFTLTPSSRRRSTQRHTVERETPISRAMRPPLMTKVAFSASSLSSPATLRSVVPGKVSGIMGILIAPQRRLSLRVLDAVYKQAEVRGGGGVGQHTGGKKIGAGFRVGVGIFEGDAAGNFNYTIRPHAARNLHAFRGAFRGQVVEENGFGARSEGFDQFALVADFDLHGQGRWSYDFRIQSRGIVRACCARRLRFWGYVSVSLVERGFDSSRQRDVIFLQ